MNALVLRMTRDNDLAWAWLPYMLRRVSQFCRDMDTETTPQEAEDLVRAWFCIGDKKMGLWAVIHQDKGLVAHLFATTEPAHVDTWRYVLVRQAQVDARVDVRAETRQVFTELENWARSLGLDKIMMLTHRNPKAMSARWGFKPYKVLMQKKLSGG